MGHPHLETWLFVFLIASDGKFGLAPKSPLPQLMGHRHILIWLFVFFISCDGKFGLTPKSPLDLLQCAIHTSDTSKLGFSYPASPLTVNLDLLPNHRFHTSMGHRHLQTWLFVFLITSDGKFGLAPKSPLPHFNGPSTPPYLAFRFLDPSDGKLNLVPNHRSGTPIGHRNLQTWLFMSLIPLTVNLDLLPNHNYCAA